MTALRRRFSLTERFKLDVRAEYFNLFNHPMFANPQSSITGCSDITAFSCTAAGGAYFLNEFGLVFYNSGLTGVGTLNNTLSGAPASGGQTAQYSPGGNRSTQFTLRLTF